MNTFKIQVQGVLETTNFCKGHQQKYFILRKVRTQRKVSDSAPCILVPLSLSKEVNLKYHVCYKKKTNAFLT